MYFCNEKECLIFLGKIYSEKIYLSHKLSSEYLTTENKKINEGKDKGKEPKKGFKRGKEVRP